MPNPKSQNDLILAHLMKGKTITALQAMNLYLCMRLASRINDLKRKNYPIESKMIRTHSGKMVSQYSLAESYNPL